MLRQIIQEEIPDAKDFSLPLADLAIDSFGLIVLCGRIEAALGRP
jgi:acyl carrier protein